MMSRTALEGRPVLQETMSRALEPTVYIVDDDLSVRTALGRLFQSVGVKYELFGTAAALLARAEQGLAGCVLLDLRLQGTNGLELQKQLAATHPDVPVII